MDKPKVLICLTVWDIERFTLFMTSLIKTLKNDYYDYEFWPDNNVSFGKDRITVLNKMNEVGASHALSLQNDHAFSPVVIQKLLSQDRDVVSGLYLQRNPPFHPFIFNKKDDQIFWSTLKNESGLKSTDAIGAGFLLVTHRVIEKLANDPEPNASGISDDLYLSYLLNKHEFKMWVDLECPIGHITYVTVVPVKDDKGNWKPSILIHNTLIPLELGSNE